MLPLPNLDDRTFKEIMEDARRMIPRLVPAWTDMNYHDPGITMIELLSWLLEMQQYHLDRITVKNEMKFLKLLGYKPRQAEPARTEVSFNGAAAEFFLPAGTPLAAGDRIFESDDFLWLLPARLEKVIVVSDIGLTDYTSFNNPKALSFLAFGKEARRNNRLYLGFDRPLAAQKVLSLAVRLFEDYPVPKGSGGQANEELIASARVAWKYFGYNGQEGEWLPVEVLHDETVHFSNSGRIKFRLPGEMKAAQLNLASDRPRYLLCAVLEEEGYETAPRIQEISINTVPVLHKETLAETTHFSSDGRAGQQFLADSYLAVYGHNRLQVRDERGVWHYYDEVQDLSSGGPADQVYALNINESNQLVLSFGDGGGGAVPPAGDNNIRLVSSSPRMASNWLGRSNGLPGQRFRAPYESIVSGSLRLQVGKTLSAPGRYVWEDWRQVDDFDASGPNDRHFVFDEETGEVVFGNNENGLIPEQGEQENIFIIACRLGGGEKGNVKENEINLIISPPRELQGLEADNHFPAWGGCAGESLAETKLRLIKDMSIPRRAVTIEDFENIALQTPGLRVARVKALPLFGGYLEKKAAAQVSVVAVPFSDSKKPLPSAGFMATMSRHLESRRLVCTEVHVIPPVYIKINVYAVVIAESRFNPDPARIKEALEGFLQAVDSREPRKGWPFGRPVYKGDIYEIINHLAGVEYVKELWLDAEGPGSKKDFSGDIQIPPHGLVYLGECEIELMQRSDL